MNKFFKTTFSFLTILVFVFFVFYKQVNAEGIDGTNFISYLCSDINCTTGSRIFWETTNGTAVDVSDTKLTGNLWGTNVGWINLNPTHGGVSNTTGGILSGYAWGQNTGWINFHPTHGGVSIDINTGKFSGYAWAQNYGWIKFDCASGVNFCVETTWRHILTGGGPSGGGGISTPPEPPTPPAPENPTPTPIPTPIPTPPAPTCAELGTCPGNPPTLPEPENPVANPSEPSQNQNVVAAITSFLNEIHSPIQNFLQNNFTPQTLQKIDVGLKLTTIGSAVVGGTVSFASVLFLNPLSFNELLLIPFRLWSLLLTALGLKKKVKPWGTVYDSVTKQPLDPVYVSLLNLEGEEIASSITDIDGRYGFFTDPGVYKVVPKKTNYIFPSHALSNHLNDEFYQDLYFGDYMNIVAGQIITNNVPMDPVNFDWNEFAKNKKLLFKFYSKKELLIARISNILFGFGFTVSAIALIVSPEIFNIIIFGLYILMFILRRTKFKLKAKGRVFDKDGTPMSFSFIRVFSVATNVEISHKVIDKLGRYHIILPNGNYYVKIEKKNDDGTYSLVHTSEPFEVKHGTLNKVFNI